MLRHARSQADERGLDQLLVVDVDSQRDVTPYWLDIVSYLEDDVMQHASRHRASAGLKDELGRGASLHYVNDVFEYGHDFHDLFGRIPHQSWNAESPGAGTPVDFAASCHQAMEAMGVDVQVVVPETLINLGRTPLSYGEAQISYAYNRWLVDHVSAHERRVKSFLYLPFRTPAACERIVSEMADSPAVVGFLVTSLRYDAVQDNRYARLYSLIEESGKPIVFYASPSWEEPWMRTMRRFLAVDALSGPHANMVHLTNWVMSGMPERFPSLKTLWLHSGVAWVAFLMQRLDSAFLKRTSEAPLLKHLPSDYMRQMFYGTHPLERDNLSLLEACMEAVNAEEQFLYASGWPQWDFDAPSAVTDLAFLSEKAKRKILGENARELFRL